MSHYDSTYFSWQQESGKLAGKANLFLFQKFIRPDEKVIDFGCGGGYLLSNLICKEKLGIEINPEARNAACEYGIRTIEKTSQAEDNWADKIISCHALEHSERPLDELKALYPKLKKGGQIIFVVPYEKSFRYKAGDINQHLYTWSEMNLGNLFSHAGFNIIKVEEIYHRFPPKANWLMKSLGEKSFHILSLFYGSIRRKMTQIRIIAERPL